MLLAQNLDTIQTSALGNTIPSSFGQIIVLVIPYVFSFAGMGLLFYIIVGGLQMMNAKGDPKAMQAAQGKITAALTGFIIIFLSYYLVKLIGTVLGITVFGNIFI